MFYNCYDYKSAINGFDKMKRKDIITYSIMIKLCSTTKDLKTGKISVDSPIGKGLLGKKVGEVAEIAVPNGKIELEILSITRD